MYRHILSIPADLTRIGQTYIKMSIWERNATALSASIGENLPFFHFSLHGTMIVKLFLESLH